MSWAAGRFVVAGNLRVKDNFLSFAHDILEKEPMSRKLEDELEECGCSLTPSGFRELLEERKATTSPTWTIDDLVCNPDEAKRFCDVIRAETGCPDMPDFLILRTLMNVRRSH